MSKLESSSNPRILLMLASFIIPSLVITLTGCQPSQPANQIQVNPTGINTGGLSLESNALPAWKEGQFGSVTLIPTGGTGPYTWSLREDSVIPDGFALSATGVLSGIAPILPSGTTRRITPPFIAVVTDVTGQRLEVPLSITIIRDEASGGAGGGNAGINPPTETTAATTSSSGTSITIDSASVTVKTEANDYASYTYTVSGNASGPVGVNFAVSAVIIDPKIGEVPLTGPQNATGSWSITQGPNYKSVRFEEKAGEPGSITWTITGSGKEGASYTFPGCVIEFRAILRLNGVNVQRQTIQVKAN